MYISHVFLAVWEANSVTAYPTEVGGGKFPLVLRLILAFVPSNDQMINRNISKIAVRDVVLLNLYTIPLM
ncbi:hypothetical protein J6590_056834 [Homalodisca vitripennis]|nr:hypothetical protein J6590_056834 [Homalodisca vitripennis]